MNLGDRLRVLLPALHVEVYRRSNGRVGSSFGRANICLLTTTGRKTGLARTTPLNYMPDGASLVLVASNGGSAEDPGWYRNLKAHPQVLVQLGRQIESMTARVASAEERAELWPRVVAWYRGYARYQARATREIPLVILDEERND